MELFFSYFFDESDTKVAQNFNSNFKNIAFKRYFFSIEFSKTLKSIASETR